MQHRIINLPETEYFHKGTFRFYKEINTTLAAVTNTHRVQRPALCTPALTKAIALAIKLDTTDKDEKHKFYANIRKHAPDFVDAIFDFIFTLRTVEELETVQTRLSFCSCRKSNRYIAHLHLYKADFLELVAIVFNTAREFVSNLHVRSLERHIAKEQQDDSSISNTGKAVMAHYILDNTDQIMEMCQRWFTLVPHSLITHFVATCIDNYVVDFVEPILSRPRFVSMVATEYRKQAIAVTRSLTADKVQNITLIGTFLHQFIRPEFKPSHRRELLHHDARSIYETVLILLDFLEEDRARGIPMRETMPKLWSQIAVVSYDAIPDKQEGEEVDDRIPLLSNVNAIASDREPFSQVLLNLQTLRVLQHCGLPSCGNVPTGTQRGFSKCGSCSVLKFCSKECQIDAWTSGTELSAPHKVYCKRWGALCKVWAGQLDQGSLQDSARQWNDRLRQLAEPLGEGYKEQDMRELYAGIQNLKRAFKKAQKDRDNLMMIRGLLADGNGSIRQLENGDAVIEFG